MKHIALALLLVFGMGTQAQAFFIEPFVNYGTGDNPDASNTEYTATEFGARVGGSTLGFLYGLEYTRFSGDYEAGSTKDDIGGSDIGITVGYDFPIMIRAYATYFLKSEATRESTVDIDFEGSGGTRIGVGFTMLPFININLEMITRSYDENTAGGLTTEDDTDLEGYNIGISIPLP